MEIFASLHRFCHSVIPVTSSMRTSDLRFISPECFLGNSYSAGLKSNYDANRLAIDHIFRPTYFSVIYGPITTQTVYHHSLSANISRHRLFTEQLVGISQSKGHKTAWLPSCETQLCWRYETRFVVKESDIKFAWECVWFVANVTKASSVHVNVTILNVKERH